MRSFREFYDRRPMITVRLVSFFGGIPLVCILLASIHELFGLEVYQRLYVSVLSLLSAGYLFFLGKAAMAHVKKDHTWYSTKRTFYYRYSIFLRVLMVIFAIASILELLGL